MTTKKQAAANKRIAQASAKKRGNTMRGTRRGGTPSPYPKEGGKLQHQFRMEQQLGRALKPGEVVHHKDENKKNSSPKNLKLEKLEDHVSHHRKGKR
jgi:hypothetical protein